MCIRDRNVEGSTIVDSNEKDYTIINNKDPTVGDIGEWVEQDETGEFLVVN